MRCPRIREKGREARQRRTAGSASIEAREIDPALEEERRSDRERVPRSGNRRRVHDGARVHFAELVVGARALVQGSDLDGTSSNTALPLVNPDPGDPAAVRELTLHKEVAVDMVAGEVPVYPEADIGILKEPETDVCVAALVVEGSLLSEIQNLLCVLDVICRVRVTDIVLRWRDGANSSTSTGPRQRCPSSGPTRNPYRMTRRRR